MRKARGITIAQLSEKIGKSKSISANGKKVKLVQFLKKI